MPLHPFDRPTLPPPEDRTKPDLPRTGLGHQLPPRGEDSDREVLLRAMHELELRMDQKIKASIPPPPPEPRPWDDRIVKILAALSTLIATAAVLKPVPKNEKVVEFSQDAAVAIKALEDRINHTDSSLESLRAWLAGYLTSTGVKVTDPQGAPPKSIVELQPAPLQADDVVRGKGAPSIQVKTPMPLPPASAAPIELHPLSKE